MPPQSPSLQTIHPMRAAKLIMTVMLMVVRSVSLFRHAFQLSDDVNVPMVWSVTWIRTGAQHH